MVALVNAKTESGLGDLPNVVAPTSRDKKDKPFASFYLRRFYLNVRVMCTAAHARRYLVRTLVTNCQSTYIYIYINVIRRYSIK